MGATLRERKEVALAELVSNLAAGIRPLGPFNNQECQSRRSPDLGGERHPLRRPCLRRQLVPRVRRFFFGTDPMQT